LLRFMMLLGSDRRSWSAGRAGPPTYIWLPHWKAIP